MIETNTLGYYAYSDYSFFSHTGVLDNYIRSKSSEVLNGYITTN